MRVINATLSLIATPPAWLLAFVQVSKIKIAQFHHNRARVNGDPAFPRRLRAICGILQLIESDLALLL